MNGSTNNRNSLEVLYSGTKTDTDMNADVVTSCKLKIFPYNNKANVQRSNSVVCHNLGSGVDFQCMGSYSKSVRCCRNYHLCYNLNIFTLLNICHKMMYFKILNIPINLHLKTHVQKYFLHLFPGLSVLSF